MLKSIEINLKIDKFNEKRRVRSWKDTWNNCKNFSHVFQHQNSVKLYDWFEKKILQQLTDF